MKTGIQFVLNEKYESLIWYSAPQVGFFHIVPFYTKGNDEKGRRGAIVSALVLCESMHFSKHFPRQFPEQELE
jgi:hypothetical protein